MSPSTFLRLFTHIQMLPILESGEETLVGGQAVMEGVMMRAPHSYCVAVRKPNGEIITDEMPVSRLSEKNKIWKLPILRGIGTLGQAMSLGLKALRFSANAALAEDAAEKPKEISNWALACNLIFSLAFFIVMYKLVPLYLVTQLGHVSPPSTAGSRSTRLMASSALRSSSVSCWWSPARKISGASSNITARSTKWSSTTNPASRSTSKMRSISSRGIPAAAPVFCWWSW